MDRKKDTMDLGCSSFSLETLDQKHLLGRTYDMFGNLDGNKIAFTPRGHKINLEIEQESNIIESKYSFLGMAVLGLYSPIMVDGINEKGLMAALLNYPSYAIYNTQPDNNEVDVHPAFFLNYLLSQCKSIEEVVKQVRGLNLTDEKVFGKEMKVHYILTDSTGETIIIEPDQEGLVVHRDTIGVLTNSPNYLWHKTNLNNYVGVTNIHKLPQTIVNYEINGFGEGVGGGFGLPGDYSSPSRFIRMAFLKEFAVKAKSEIDGITKMFHNFAAVDIPEGILKESKDKEHYEQTLCISAMCSESLTYYFAPSTNRRISAIPLANIRNLSQMQYFDLQVEQDIAYLK